MPGCAASGLVLDSVFRPKSALYTISSPVWETTSCRRRWGSRFGPHDLTLACAVG